MTQTDYEQKKCECFEEFCKRYRIEEPSEQNIESFNWIFDRAYALGKEKETISQEEIEKAAIEYVLIRQQAKHNAKKEEDATMRDFDKTIKAWDAYDMEQAFESGANLFLGKQEKDAEKSKEKLMCLRDRTKVCNRCHACDIDADAWHSMYSR